MKPTVPNPLDIRGRKFGGPAPLFCIPLVAAEPEDLVSQAQVARDLNPDLVEWRADYSKDVTPGGLDRAAQQLRKSLPDLPVLFTLRIKGEGGAQYIPQDARREAIEVVLRSGLVDIADLELANEPEFLQPLMSIARQHRVPIILAFHDFQGTPASATLLDKVEAMRAAGANVAKLAVMPETPGDVLRLMQLTSDARKMFPGLPLSIMSMGALGSISRVANFLYGSDMAFAVGKQASAPGQIPIADARLMANLLLKYS